MSRAAVLPQISTAYENTTLSLSIREDLSTGDKASRDGDALAVSPYGYQPDHVLLLDSVDAQSRLLAFALTRLHALNPDYATAAYREAFNWEEVMNILKEMVTASDRPWSPTSFFVVVFRSQIPPTTQYSDLGALDKAAHSEATKSGGFLKYWFGVPDTSGRNLATCIWCTAEHARRGGIGPAHQQAAAAARHLYTNWTIERLALDIGEGANSWSIRSWSGEG